ncbi:hypothetical protein WJX73_006785 [Symbiochloris irregularis]|uniref:Glycosyltransferase 61 catalytic domain-containing protein n=1 Tax=Symbiochloris irregularis TaxID=706552 RepID=A0AAW1NRZ5_9CHLO
MSLCFPFWAFGGFCVAAAALLVSALGQGVVPHNSTVVVPEGKHYAVFHDILLQEQGVVFYLPDELADGPVDGLHQPPDLKELLTWQGWWPNPERWKVDIISRRNATQARAKCARWVEKPVLLYHGMPVDGNMYHFFTDNIMRVFATLDETGLLDVDSSIARDHEPSSEEANLIILQAHLPSWTAKFHELFDHLTPDQWSFPHGAGTCYRTLIFGTNTAPACYALSTDQAAQDERTHIQLRFRRWAMAKQLHIDDRDGRDIQHPPASNGRLQIRLISRGRNDFGSRAILNEDEIVKAIQQRYADTVDVNIIKFNGSLSTAMLAMNATDLLIGVHGAGMTNILWLPPGSSVIQLMPYGWRDQHMREHDPSPASILFQQLSANANASYFLWENVRPEHAFLGKAQHEDQAKHLSVEERRAMHEWKLHPDAHWATDLRQYRPGAEGGHGEMYWHWKAQDTYVDLVTFMPLVDQALTAVRLAKQA